METVLESSKVWHVYKDYPNAIIYTVNKRGIITGILTHDTWDQFAADNDVALPTGKMVGKSLYGFMGPSLGKFYEEVIAQICEASDFSASFRWFCDSPEHRREMVMVMEKAYQVLACCCLLLAKCGSSTLDTKEGCTMGWSIPSW